MKEFSPFFTVMHILSHSFSKMILLHSHGKEIDFFCVARKIKNFSSTIYRELFGLRKS